jgi:hypothetical protein
MIAIADALYDARFIACIIIRLTLDALELTRRQPRSSVCNGRMTGRAICCYNLNGFKTRELDKVDMYYMNNYITNSRVDEAVCCDCNRHETCCKMHLSLDACVYASLSAIFLIQCHEKMC